MSLWVVLNAIFMLIKIRSSVSWFTLYKDLILTVRKYTIPNNHQSLLKYSGLSATKTKQKHTLVHQRFLDYLVHNSREGMGELCNLEGTEIEPKPAPGESIPSHTGHMHMVWVIISQ